MDPAWAAPAVATLHDLYELSPADPGRSSIVYSGLPQAASHAPAPRMLVWHAPVQSDAVDSCVTPRGAERLAHLGRCAVSQCRGLTPTPEHRGSPTSRPHGHTRSGPPFCHDGTERPIPRPTDTTEQ